MWHPNQSILLFLVLILLCNSHNFQSETPILNENRIVFTPPQITRNFEKLASGVLLLYLVEKLKYHRLSPPTPPPSHLNFIRLMSALNTELPCTSPIETLSTPKCCTYQMLTLLALKRKKHISPAIQPVSQHTHSLILLQQKGYTGYGN